MSFRECRLYSVNSREPSEIFKQGSQMIRSVFLNTAPGSNIHAQLYLPKFPDAYLRSRVIPKCEKISTSYGTPKPRKSCVMPRGGGEKAPSHIRVNTQPCAPF